MRQITNTILMIKPLGFRYNEQTAVNNYYQKIIDNLTPKETQEDALNEFRNFVVKLRKYGVEVIVIEDVDTSDTPDSIFPNNWVSFHNDGRIVLYPMCAKNRRDERRKDIFDILVNDYLFAINGIQDFTQLEEEDKFLEGTGSMVLDRENKICYAAISVRTDKFAVMKFCKEFSYIPVCFTATQDIGSQRMKIYHTNVMMCIADKFAVICLDAIEDEKERKYVIQSLAKTGKDIIEITEVQKNRFAGNMLQVMGHEPLLVMSTSAYSSLMKEQKEAIEKHCPILHTSLDTIEACGGGSARCMIAEIFLPKQK